MASSEWLLVQKPETILKQYITSFEQEIIVTNSDGVWLYVMSTNVFELCLTI